MSVTLYYGMSGTFKTSTINAVSDPTRDETLFSGIKYWKSLETGIFNSLTTPSHLNYAMLHLSRIKDFLNRCDSACDFRIERGITDMLYYYQMYADNSLTEDEISNAVIEENRLLTGREVRKVLLIQEDEDFVRRRVWTGDQVARTSHFRDWGDFLCKQEGYVDFTKKFNKITEIIRITNAEEYLMSLGVGIDNN